ncbi:hypothetical protein A4X13_0g4899 [Tilletia indica]|uniref:Uncharacterized protein n=1 Tax=Tilletia indica TaxID=43049 RepID=A0A8T8SYH1_9BASI|nr:hypothetical protein A4X13_0g4899 [Tilletia indica]
MISSIHFHTASLVMMSAQDSASLDEANAKIRQGRKEFLQWHLHELMDGQFIQCLTDALLDQLLQPFLPQDIGLASVMDQVIFKGNDREEQSRKRKRGITPEPRPSEDSMNAVNLLRQTVMQSRSRLSSSQLRVFKPALDGQGFPTEIIELPLVKTAPIDAVLWKGPDLADVSFSSEEHVMKVDLTKKGLCDDEQICPSGVGTEVQRMLRTAIRPPESRSWRCQRAPIWTESWPLQTAFEEATMWNRASIFRTSTSDEESYSEKARYGSDARSTAEIAPASKSPLFAPFKRLTASPAQFKGSADLLARVEVCSEKLSATQRLFSVVENADDISTLSVNTSQHSTSTEGSGRREDPTGSASEPLPSVLIASAGCESLFEVTKTQGKAALSSLFESPILLSASEHDYDWRSSSYVASHKNLIRSTELLRRFQVTSPKAETMTPRPTITAVTSSLHDLWQQTLNVGTICIIDAPGESYDVTVDRYMLEAEVRFCKDHGIPRPKPSEAFVCKAKNILSEVKLNPVSEVEMGARSISHHHSRSFTLESLGGHLNSSDRAAATISALKVGCSALWTRPPFADSRLANGGELAEYTIQARSTPATRDDGRDGDVSNDGQHGNAEAAFFSETGWTQNLERRRSNHDAGPDGMIRHAHAEKDTFGTTTNEHEFEPGLPISLVRTEPSSNSPAFIGSALLNVVQSRRARTSKNPDRFSGVCTLQPSMNSFLFQRRVASVEQKVDPRPETTSEEANILNKETTETQDEGQEDVYEPQSRHLYAASVRMLQNVAVLTELQALQIELVERDADDVDLVLDPTSAVIFIRTSLLAESLQLPGSSQNRQGIHRGWLRRLMNSDRFDKILVVCEQYTSSGLSVDITPPVQVAIDEFHSLIKTRDISSGHNGIITSAAQYGRPQFELVFAESPKRAAFLCRQFADQLEQEAQDWQSPYLTEECSSLTRSRHLTSTTWTDRASWLCRSPTNGELHFSSSLNPVAAAFVTVAQEWIASLPGKQEREEALLEAQKILGAERLDAI